MLSKSASRALTKWTPINEKIIVARLTGRQAKLTVLACYEPTNEADDTTKDNFYNTLQAVAKDIPSHDLVCFVGDFDAKVGSDKSYCPEVLGSQGLGEINENGILLVDFALTNDLIIGGTQSQHKTIRKYSWNSPDGRTHNQIDHILINKKWKSSLQDVRAYRGADVASDHALMIAKLSLKLKATKKSQPKRNLPTTLKSSQTQQFVIGSTYSLQTGLRAWP
ncbi:craniofacial development protein 2-like [Artemia franciscana]|uniref:craniofacial development protein 2-like n=1 Tax=Artemia franciscana TaxID=6661 RepID=UPI0032DA3BB9